MLSVQAYRRVASREERELQDVERCMEEELVAEHMQVERVIHLRSEVVQGQQQLKYLVKVSTFFFTIWFRLNVAESK